MSQWYYHAKHVQTHCQSYVQPTGCTKSVSENSVYIHGHRVIGNDTVATAGVFNQLSHNRQPVSTLNIFCLCLWRAVFRQLLFDRRILLFAVDNSLCISGLKIIMETDLAQLRVYNWSRKAPSYVSLVSSSLSCMGSIIIINCPGLLLIEGNEVMSTGNYYIASYCRLLHRIWVHHGICQFPSKF